jgi:hypothetical protein
LKGLLPTLWQVPLHFYFLMQHQHQPIWFHIVVRIVYLFFFVRMVKKFVRSICFEFSCLPDLAVRFIVAVSPNKY